MTCPDDQVRMKRIVLYTSLAALALAACGSDDAGIEIEGAWARTSPASTSLGAAYFEVTADEADTLLAVSVPSSIAGRAEIHEMVAAEMSEDDMSEDEMSGDDMSEDGMDMEDGEMAMTMQQMTAGLPLPAGETVALAPGGYHIMLIDLVEPLDTGDEFDITLDFENADDMTVTVEVAESAP